jgi:fructuronate reductase
MEPLSLSSVTPKNLILKKRPTITGIVHIGLGNFHRAHLAIYTAIAMEKFGGNWGICAYSMRNEKLVSGMRTQDNLYSVVEIGPETEAAVIPGVHTRTLVGESDLPELIAQIANPETKIVSLTVTEAGYYISQGSRGLDIQHPDVINDLSGKISKTIYGILTQALSIRARIGAGPITILSCDNVASNGSQCHSLILEFVEHIGNSELKDFISTQVSFPNSMVDRIVPGTESAHLTMAAKRLGVTDAIPVPAEKFTMWAVEDNFIAGRPQWEAAGAIFTTEVEKFEVMKLRLLNGAHSLLAYVGALSGHQTIPESRFNPLIERALREALYKEYLPSLEMPSGLNADTYIEQLFMRWSNTALGDKTARVGSDGSSKLPQRITVPALESYARGEEPKILALTVAAWLMCISEFNGFERGPYAEQMKDPARLKIIEIAKSSAEVATLVTRFFAESGVFSNELSDSASFVQLTTRYTEIIMSQGIADAITASLS